jgi:hypothetical protein
MNRTTYHESAKCVSKRDQRHVDVVMHFKLNQRVGRETVAVCQLALFSVCRPDCLEEKLSDFQSEEGYALQYLLMRVVHVFCASLMSIDYSLHQLSACPRNFEAKTKPQDVDKVMV